jgi:hypothetical protein
MQRDQARLRAEADQRGDRHKRLRTAALRRERRGVTDRSVVGKREQRDPDRSTAQMRNRKVGVNRGAHAPLTPSGEDRGSRHERHQLPERQEARHVTRGKHTDQRQQERRRQWTDHPCAGTPR